MAVVGREVHVRGGDDHIVAVQRERVVDPQRGVALEVEKKVVAVDLGDGRIAVAEQERVVGATLPLRVRM